MKQTMPTAKSQNKDASFMVHILSFGGLIAALLITQSQPVLNHPAIIIVASTVYLAVNTYVDYRKKHLSSASFAQYSAITILAVVVALSFR
jgi:hypothetical protein